MACTSFLKSLVASPPLLCSFARALGATPKSSPVAASVLAFFASRSCDLISETDCARSSCARNLLRHF